MASQKKILHLILEICIRKSLLVNNLPYMENPLCQYMAST
jgi:hypothetical protein